MSVIWIIERADAPLPRLANALIGDYAVRAFASLASFTQLLRLRRGHLPDLLLVDAEAEQATPEQLLAAIACHLPTTPVVFVAGDCGHASSEDRPRVVPAHLHTFHRPVDGLRLSAFVDLILQGQEASNPRSIIRYRGVMLDYQRLECVVAPSDAATALPRKEAQLLRLLLERPGVCLSREEIRDAIWEEVRVTPRTIDSHVSRLRQRLDSADVQIVTVYGGGYVLR